MSSDALKNHATLIAAATALLELAKQYASECGDCAGTGITITDDPCDECRFIRDVIDEAQDPVESDLDRLVDRFLAWPLPASVRSDMCVTYAVPSYQRSGTNLLTATEARAMLKHVLGIWQERGT